MITETALLLGSSEIDATLSASKVMGTTPPLTTVGEPCRLRSLG